MLQEIYLVLSATGRQGSAVVDALVANNANVFGSSRNPESLRKIRGMFSVSQIGSWRIFVVQLPC